MTNTQANEPTTASADDPAAGHEAAQSEEPAMVEHAGTGTSTGGILVALMGQLGAFRMILRGYPPQALQLAERIPRFWMVSFFTAALIFGLSAATSVTRAVSAANSAMSDFFSPFGGYRSSYISVNVGQWFGLVLVGFVFACTAFLLRAVTLKWLFAVRRAPQPFSVGANVLAVAYSGNVVVYLAAFILMFLPGAVFGTVVGCLAAVLLGLLNFAAEFVIYIGVNRAVHFEKSTLVPHVLLSAAWVALVALVYAILFGMFAESLLG